MPSGAWLAGFANTAWETSWNPTGPFGILSRAPQLPDSATRKNLGAFEPPACKGMLAGKSMLTVSTGSALSPDNLTGVVPAVVQLA